MWQWFRLSIEQKEREGRDLDYPPFTIIWIHAQSWKEAINKAEEAIKGESHYPIVSASLDCQSEVVWGKIKEDFPPGFRFQILETRPLPK